MAIVWPWSLTKTETAFKNCSKQSKSIKTEDKVHQKYLLPPQNPFFTLVYNHLASHLPIALGEFKMNVLFFSIKSIDSTVFDVVVLSQNLSIRCNQYKIYLSHMVPMDVICAGNKIQQPDFFFFFQIYACFSFSLGKTMKCGWHCFGFSLTKQHLISWLMGLEKRKFNPTVVSLLH